MAEPQPINPAEKSWNLWDYFPENWLEKLILQSFSKETQMAEPDAMTLFEALEQILIERRWLNPGEVRSRAEQILNHRAAVGEPLPNENTEG